MKSLVNVAVFLLAGLTAIAMPFPEDVASVVSPSAAADQLSSDNLIGSATQAIPYADPAQTVVDGVTSALANDVPTPSVGLSFEVDSGKSKGQSAKSKDAIPSSAVATAPSNPVASSSNLAPSSASKPSSAAAASPAPSGKPDDKNNGKKEQGDKTKNKSGKKGGR